MNIHNNILFIEDTNKLMLKNKKINIKNNESILKNKFWMNVYEKMKAIIYNYKYQNNITYKTNHCLKVIFQVLLILLNFYFLNIN